MAKIILDGCEFQCRDGVSVLQAALEAGFDVPHYCYHPGLSIVASCRLCLMETKVPDPKTKEMTWSPKLVPSCQTPVRDGMEIRFDSDRVRENVRQVMEDFLLNHPLDCPVCDQAGECYLQDYSQKFGDATSRMVEEKHKNPKKDVGPRTLLYQDRCVLCTRCVRFTREVAGTGELCVVNRGSRLEIDAFPGLPLANRLQGNVVDLCPVGALLDKDFLFKQRVWLLQGARSICPGCSTGCAIRIDHNDGRIHRLKPRHNPGVNDWWMCDEGRFGWKYVHDERRLVSPMVRRGTTLEPLAWEDVSDLLRFRLREIVRARGPGSVAVVLSPMMACEEAWLLATFIRDLAPQAWLAAGEAPATCDEYFPFGAAADKAKFTIRAEKVPNRRGIEMILAGLRGNVATRDELLERAGKGEFAAAWIVGGYPPGLPWPSKELLAAAAKIPFLVAQDLFANDLTRSASIVLPSAAWAERDGTFVNAIGLIQPFERAINPPEGGKPDGQYLFEIAGHQGLYSGERVREMMIEPVPAFAAVHEVPEPPAHQH